MARTDPAMPMKVVVGRPGDQARAQDFGRGVIGHRRILPAIAETIGIAVAAAIAGLAIGKLIS